MRRPTQPFLPGIAPAGGPERADPKPTRRVAPVRPHCADCGKAPGTLLDYDVLYLDDRPAGRVKLCGPCACRLRLVGAIKGVKK